MWEGDVTELVASVLADRTWLREDLRRAAGLYGAAGDRVLGTIRWYSASSMVVAPALESLVHTGTATDPSLDAVMLDVHHDGRILDARALHRFEGGIGRLAETFADALGAAVEAIAEVSGATPRSLWAIAADSIGNRLLWAGARLDAAEDAMRLAGKLGDGIAATGAPMPRPLFTEAGGKPVVRRTSCCLIYEIPNGQKCASCPKQTPEERTRRLRSLLG